MSAPPTRMRWWGAARRRPHGATITHHHAIGRDHAPWLAREIGDVGVEALRAIKARLDPTGIMNPGKLLAD